MKRFPRQHINFIFLEDRFFCVPLPSTATFLIRWFPKCRKGQQRTSRAFSLSRTDSCPAVFTPVSTTFTAYPPLGRHSKRDDCYEGLHRKKNSIFTSPPVFLVQFVVALIFWSLFDRGAATKCSISKGSRDDDAKNGK